MQMAARGQKEKKKSSHVNATLGHKQIKRIWDEVCTRRDKLGALEFDSRCLHAIIIVIMIIILHILISKR